MTTATTAPAHTAGETFIRSIAIGVSDMRKTIEFYSKVFGMQHIQSYDLPNKDEIVIGFPEAKRGGRLCLMHWTDGSNPNYRDLPIKIVLEVPDANEVARRVTEAGYEMTRGPFVSPASGSTIGFAKDPDGYVVEFMQLAH